MPREGSDRELLRRVQNLNRFVLEQMHKEMTGKEGSATSAIDLVFGADMMRTQMVLGVGGGGAAKEPVKDPAAQQQSREFQWRLVYAKADSAGSAVKTEPAAIKADGAGAQEAASEAAAAAPPTFAQVLQGALCSEQTTRAWHEASKSYKPTKVRRAMTSAPNVLCIDRFRHFCHIVCHACGIVSWGALAAAPRVRCITSGIEFPHTGARDTCVTYILRVLHTYTRLHHQRHRVPARRRRQPVPAAPSRPPSARTCSRCPRRPACGCWGGH